MELIGVTMKVAGIVVVLIIARVSVSCQVGCAPPPPRTLCATRADIIVPIGFVRCARSPF